MLLNFNSRPSARGDTITCERRYPIDHISIHAPPRGATGRCTGLLASLCISIHAPPRGATTAGSIPCLFLLFQFTPLREGRRPCCQPTGHLSVHFNSRPSARGDQKHVRAVLDGQISIHAPPRGATLLLLFSQAHRYISIHAPPRGATRFGVCDWRGVCISIHAPPRGATAKDMQFLQIFCSTLTNQHGLTIMPRNLSRLFW